MNEVNFTHNGQNHQIRVHILDDGSTINVRAFKDGASINGFNYSVTMPVVIDMRTILGVDAIQKLIDHAKQDVFDDRWEKLLKALEDQ